MKTRLKSKHSVIPGQSDFSNVFFNCILDLKYVLLRQAIILLAKKHTKSRSIFHVASIYIYVVYIHVYSKLIN